MKTAIWNGQVTAAEDLRSLPKGAWRARYPGIHCPWSKELVWFVNPGDLGRAASFSAHHLEGCQGTGRTDGQP